jgi:hypothetical protein
VLWIKKVLKGLVVLVMVSIILVQVVMQADNPFFSSHFPIFPIHFTAPSLHFMIVQLQREEDLLKRKKLQEEKIFMKKNLPYLKDWSAWRSAEIHYLMISDIQTFSTLSVKSYFII